jgi:hypothetical protein
MRCRRSPRRRHRHRRDEDSRESSVAHETKEESGPGRVERGVRSESERAAVLPPGDPAKASYVRRVGSFFFGVPDAWGVHGRRCLGSQRFHTDRRSSGLRARTRNTPTDAKASKRSENGRQASWKVGRFRSSPPLAPASVKGKRRRRTKAESVQDEQEISTDADGVDGPRRRGRSR